MHRKNSAYQRAPKYTVPQTDRICRKEIAIKDVNNNNNGNFREAAKQRQYLTPLEVVNRQRAYREGRKAISDCRNMEKIIGGLKSDIGYLTEQGSNLQNDAAHYRQRARKAESDLDRYIENYNENQQKADDELTAMRKQAEKAEHEVAYMKKNGQEADKVSVALVTISMMYTVAYEECRKLEDKYGGMQDQVDDRLEEKAEDQFDRPRMHKTATELAKLFYGSGHKNRVWRCKLTSADVSDSLVGAYAPEVDTEAMDLHASDIE